MNPYDYQITPSVEDGHTWGVQTSQKVRGECIPDPIRRKRENRKHSNARTQRGRLVQDQTTKQPKLNCRNWECGVLVPVLDRADSSDKVSNNNSGKGANESADMLDVFRGTVPVPMTVPGQRYGPGLKPWFF
jgi:hypothetical protein